MGQSCKTLIPFFTGDLTMKLTLEQHEFDVLKEMVSERYDKLVSILEKQNNVLDEYERDIKNYTTYTIHAKLMEVK